jgi:mRNA interferase RelE/StbE
LPRLRIPEAFRNQLAAKSAPDRAAIANSLITLSSDPRHPGLRTKKVKGTKGVFEARASRALRITFHWDEGAIVLRRNCSHAILDRSP